MKITIETTDAVMEAPHGGRGAVCEGVTDDGVPVLVVLTSIGCQPQHRAAFERSMQSDRARGHSTPCGRRRTARRTSWRDRLLGVPSPN
jgi:hypothetical protein